MEPAAEPVTAPEKEWPGKILVVHREWLEANAKASVHDSEVPPGLDEQARIEWMAAELERKREKLVRYSEVIMSAMVHSVSLAASTVFVVTHL
jgi:hypothetical protein